MTRPPASTHPSYPALLGLVLDRLVVDLREALADNLVGIYLYGSAVTGSFVRGVSDIDLAVVTARDVSELDLARLDAVHEAAVARDARWLDRLDIVYVGRSALLAFRTSSAPLAVISPGEPFHVSGPIFDWAQNWYLVRESGVTLAGPPADEVVPAIDAAGFLEAVVRYARFMRDLPIESLEPGPLAYNVLTACRALRAVRTGRHASKEEGAAWVRERLPDQAWVIDAALACRLARGREGLDDEPTRAAAAALVRRLVDEVIGAGAGGRPSGRSGGSIRPR